ncbi:hypothetical protein O6H91_13G043600 [Diphasiastrum complanatum]|uniref:Uncharacterized protein n=1 Tax=Diphasiastrum complanatum TaxID=34168 RepID=A0ACC2BUG3_DIPCM|nr:hypothetical protein O6H91_13G043600 [Diphasiastrum complanatum]
MPNKNWTRRGGSNCSEGPEQLLAKKRRPKNLGAYSSGRLKSGAPKNRASNGQRNFVDERESDNILIEAMDVNVHEPINLNLDGLASVYEAEEKTIKPHVKAKKVRFSLKNNVVWKPDGPLPPLSVRLPPLAMPRGSALKKGLSPGPICILAPAKPKSSSKRRLMILTQKKLKNAKRFSKVSKSRKTG